MRAVVQRVEESYVKVDGKVVGRIGRGLNVLLGVKKGDTEEDIDKLVRKIANLRIFEDERGKFQHSLLDIGGEVLVISQFTLYASVKKGRRPSFELAEEPGRAEELYNNFVERFRKEGVRVETGVFGAMMDVFIRNWGPVTIVVDSEEL
ncbi:D-aminoacyl-tRNA deacylase [Hydrogenivirga sp. 128-5-R1-1]|uniref:D-aminoacyl-tRNA deacylase n=1 Tax=Hydrogenivirga sp. 128-5-R1-1 TaxID=392423 RepID=UPI00015F1732|nr:D-aminoacyl-tRNA deacylase [Hydrogenivirga sp. 128-5-R1-1]EDP76056.1 D-tyrosyl-tRNA deacylase [Hydrogenivirga sp. 128-5-R1-1]